MKLKPIEWIEYLNSHRCVAVDGAFPDGDKTAFIDIQVGSNDDCLVDKDPESLVGKIIDYDYLHTYIYIASGTRPEEGVDDDAKDQTP